MLEGSTLGALVELMVEAEVLTGSEGRLIPSRVEPDRRHSAGRHFAVVQAA